MLSKLTIIGLSQYQPDLWDELNLPEGIDVEVFKSEVLKLGGEFSLVYPNAEFMKYQIGVWSRKWYHNFDRWLKAYNFEYEALYNLDVKATIEETGTNTESENIKTNATNAETRSDRTEASEGSTNHNNVSNTATSNGTNNTTDTTSKAAYDSSAFQPTEKTESNNSTNLNSSSSTIENGNTTRSSNSTNTGSTNNSLNSNTDSTSNQNHKILTEEYRRGNQGVTMSQQMLLAEYNAWYQNVYAMIAEVFVNEFCICIYN